MDIKQYLKKENIINFILYLLILIMPLIVINFSDYPRYVMGKVFFIYVTNIIAVIISFLVLIIISTPLNKVINNILEIDNLFKIDYYMVIIFLVINILIIRIIGSIPVRRANRQEIRECISSK